MLEFKKQFKQYHHKSIFILIFNLNNKSLHFLLPFENHQAYGLT